MITRNNDPRSRFVAATFLVFAIFCSGNGCVSYHRVSYSTHSDTRSTPPPPSTPDLPLVPRTVALFVGVSNYGEQAKVFSTPRKTLSAARFRYSFDGCARLAGQNRRGEQA